jgi:uncharacterized protein
VRAQWASFLDDLGDLRARIPAELAAHRGGWRKVQRARVADTKVAQTDILPSTIPETIALMLLGIALHRSGFFAGAWTRRRYGQVIAIGYGLCLPLYLPLVWWLTTTRFDPVVMILVEAMHLVLLRPWIALAHAAVAILFMRSGALRWLADRLAATGRMAFSNYLATSIVCTTIFYGYGIGWFGYLQRWQLYPIVLGLWIAMLLWSRWWLERFAYGPFEWLWRSMARGRIQAIRRPAGTA